MKSSFFKEEIKIVNSYCRENDIQPPECEVFSMVDRVCELTEQGKNKRYILKCLEEEFCPEDYK